MSSDISEWFKSEAFKGLPLYKRILRKIKYIKPKLKKSIKEYIKKR